MIKFLCFFIISLSFAEELTINVNNIKSTKGKMQIAIHNSSETYLVDDKLPYQGLIEPIDSENFELTVHLPKGNYAVAIFHDENENGELDTNFIGIPTEPFGFSNNPTIVFGAPNFEEAKFSLREKNSISIHLKSF